ncbi:MAG: Oligopeptide transport system permease protein OppB, partial [uncultured Rubellimicrobium sp.]
AELHPAPPAGGDPDDPHPDRHLLRAHVQCPRRPLQLREGAARGRAAQHRGALRARPALRRADLQLREEHRPSLRLRPVVQAARPDGVGADCPRLPGDVDLRVAGLRAGDGAGGGAGRRGGDAAQYLARLRRHGHGHRRVGAAELRARAAPGSGLHGLARLAARGRLELGRVGGRGDAGDRAGHELPRRHRADHPVVHAGGDEFGLHPHRPRQGPADGPDRPAPRAQARAAAGAELSGPGLRGDDHRVGGDRRLLLHGRDRAVLRELGAEPRLFRDHGRDDPRRHPDHPVQPSGRRPLRLDRPEDPLL